MPYAQRRGSAIIGTFLIRRIPARLRLPVLVYAATQLILLFWWAASYPGLMSYDSISYVWHVTTDHWMANHSVAYDGLVWLSLQTTGDLAILTFLQTVAAAAVLAYTADVLNDLGVRARWAAVATIGVVAFPLLGTFLVFVWKDVPFTICAVLAFAATGRLLARRRRGAPNEQDGQDEKDGEGVPWRAVALLATALVGLVLFRNNGFLTVVIAAPFLILALSGMRRLMTVLTAAPIALNFALTGLVYPSIGIEGARPSLTYATAYADIAVAYVKEPDTFSAYDKRLMAKVAPLKNWEYAGSNCYNADWLTNRPGFSKGAADRRNDKIIKLWIRTIGRTPDVVTGARLCRGAIAWAPWPGPRHLLGHTLVSNGKVREDRFGWALPGRRMDGNPWLPQLSHRPLSEPLSDVAGFGQRISMTPQLEWLLQRAPIWCYLGYLAIGLYAWRTRDRAVWALAAMIAGGQLAVLAANPAQLFRYMTAPMMIGMLSLPLLTLARGARRRNPADGRNDAADGRRNAADERPDASEQPTFTSRNPGASSRMTAVLSGGPPSAE